MKIIRTKSELAELLKQFRRDGLLGFVPTMGYLHRGHISLVERSISDCAHTVVSIFVNPLQFGPSEDYQRYPRDEERDSQMLDEAGVDAVFIPSVSEMYPGACLTSVNVQRLAEKLEGRFRPGHFAGVCTVVAKLLNIVQPDSAYFGWKDAQQLIIIRRMVKDLDFPVEIIGLPTVREPDGLAASSRNVYLSPGDRKKALSLSKSLQIIEKMVNLKKVNDAAVLIQEGKKVIENSGVEIQYLEAVDLENLESVEKVGKGTGILGAIKVAGIRLIDNIVWV